MACAHLNYGFFQAKISRDSRTNDQINLLSIHQSMGKMPMATRDEMLFHYVVRSYSCCCFDGIHNQIKSQVVNLKHVALYGRASCSLFIMVYRSFDCHRYYFLLQQCSLSLLKREWSSYQFTCPWGPTSKLELLVLLMIFLP